MCLCAISEICTSPCTPGAISTNAPKRNASILINSQDDDIAKKYGLRSGVGLAAPQINVSKRMIAVYLPDDGNGKAYDYMLVNPKIMSHSVQRAYLPTGEGCLSVDENIPGLVHRHFRVTIKALDIDGNEVKLRLKVTQQLYSNMRLII